MIEIKQFDGKSITPKDDALMYDLLFNGYGIFNGCSVSFLGANQLLVSSGRLIVRGRQVVITEETIAAQLSSDGTKKGRLYIHIDLSSASNPIEFRTIVADELPALTQEDDVNYNDGIFELELCNYDVSETAISNIVETCPSITGGVDLLKNMEEVMANTTPGKAADALVVKELSDRLQTVRTYVGSDGKLHFVDASGADSVLPFRRIFSMPEECFVYTTKGVYGDGYVIMESNYLKICGHSNSVACFGIKIPANTTIGIEWGFDKYSDKATVKFGLQDWSNFTQNDTITQSLYNQMVSSDVNKKTDTYSIPNNTSGFWILKIICDHTNNNANSPYIKLYGIS